MKTFVFTFISIFFLFNLSSAQEVLFENSESFFPHYQPSPEEKAIWESVSWGQLTVPENWGNPQNGKIKLAVSILKNTANKSNAEAVVFIQGGPGESAIRTIGFWKWHPIREQKDVILIDLRGTGFSEPRLCPDIGKSFLEILSKDQSEEIDEQQKIETVMNCQQDLISRNIDIASYNSQSIAKDLHALKEQLNYQQWHVYGVSYGTYVAQVYASYFPQDCKSLILDSSISEIADYYTRNTENYMQSLARVFDQCESDRECAQQYPNLKDIYFKTIADLEKQPITVTVDENIVSSGSFTYNAEDFKVAIQQALYQKQLINLLPLLIYQFHDRNEAALGNLVAAFSSLLGMDYGMYYCLTCNEVLPNNPYTEYQKNAGQYDKLGGGIAFYKSDFGVCKKWNEHTPDSMLLRHDISNLKELNIPMLTFGGEYDPITPASNARAIAETMPRAYFVDAHTQGHTPSFTGTGNQLSKQFLENPTVAPDLKAFEGVSPISFVKDIKINGGVSKMGSSLNRLDPLFLAPLLIAILLMAAFIVIHLIKLFKGRYDFLPDRIIRSGSLLTSIIGIICLIGFVLALTKVANDNYLVLAFGLPDSYSYLFMGVLAFTILAVLLLIYFAFYIRKIQDRSILFSVLFSHLICLTYFLYWGIL